MEKTPAPWMDEIIDGYAINLGCCTMEEAEAWALLHGLKMAWENDVKYLTVEIDSLMVFRWVKL